MNEQEKYHPTVESMYETKGPDIGRVKDIEIAQEMASAEEKERNKSNFVLSSEDEQKQKIDDFRKKTEKEIIARETLGDSPASEKIAAEAAPFVGTGGEKDKLLKKAESIERGTASEIGPESIVKKLKEADSYRERARDIQRHLIVIAKGSDSAREGLEKIHQIENAIDSYDALMKKADIAAAERRQEDIRRMFEAYELEFSDRKTSRPDDEEAAAREAEMVAEEEAANRELAA